MESAFDAAVATHRVTVIDTGAHRKKRYSQTGDASEQEADAFASTVVDGQAKAPNRTRVHDFGDVVIHTDALSSAAARADRRRRLRGHSRVTHFLRHRPLPAGQPGRRRLLTHKLRTLTVVQQNGLGAVQRTRQTGATRRPTPKLWYHPARGVGTSHNRDDQGQRVAAPAREELSVAAARHDVPGGRLQQWLLVATSRRTPWRLTSRSPWKWCRQSARSPLGGYVPVLKEKVRKLALDMKLADMPETFAIQMSESLAGVVGDPPGEQIVVQPSGSDVVLFVDSALVRKHDRRRLRRRSSIPLSQRCSSGPRSRARPDYGRRP